MEFRNQERGIDERIGKAHTFHNRAGLVADALHLQFEDHSDGLSGDIQRFF